MNMFDSTLYVISENDLVCSWICLGKSQEFCRVQYTPVFNIFLIQGKNGKGRTRFKNRFGTVKLLRSLLLTRMFDCVVDDEIVQFHFAGIRLHFKCDPMGTGGELT